VNLFLDIVNFLYPDACVGCFGDVGQSEKPICYSCRSRLPSLISFPVSNHPQLEKKFLGLLPLKHCLAFLKFQKGGITQRFLHALKYQNQPEVGEILGRLFAEELKKKGLQTQFDLILPIPLHSSKLKKRGYNQAMAIAKGMADGFGALASDQILIRSQATETQTKKRKLHRILNVGEVFALSEKEKGQMEGKQILLVDDVITTGSTMESCAKLLVNEPLAGLSIATLALA
jgi:ComF family protein